MQQLLETMPGLKLGINHYTKITVSESPQMLKGRLQLFQEQLFFELEDKALTDFPGIQEWRSSMEIPWSRSKSLPAFHRSTYETD